MFEGGGSAAEGTASEAQVDVLYRQIGQLKVENDLYEGFAVKQAKFLCSAEGRFSVPANGTRCVARRSGQDWPKATAVRRPGLDRFEHGAIVSPTGLSFIRPARSTFCGAVVRLAHQLISGSSVTACHNPACTAQMIEETGSHFLPARERRQSFPRLPVAPPLDPYAGLQSLEKRIASKPRRIALWP